MNNIIAYIVLLFVFLVIILLVITACTNIILRVPYVPSSRRAVQALDHITLQGNEKVCDLGSGNGRILFFLKNKYPSLSCTGYELAILPFCYAMLKNIFRRHRATFYFRNFLKEDLSSYNVFFCYLMPKAVEKVVQKLEVYHHPMLLITNTFHIPNKTPIQTIKIPFSSSIIAVYQL